MGVWKARFSLRPMAASDLDGREFVEWMRECAWIENSADSKRWASEHAPSVREKKLEYMPKWERKNDKPVLRPLDGR
jgi:hypothetical protein